MAFVPPSRLPVKQSCYLIHLHCCFFFKAWQQLMWHISALNLVYSLNWYELLETIATKARPLAKQRLPSVRPRCFLGFRQEHNLENFPAKDLWNTQAWCEGQLPANWRAWFPPDIQFVNAGKDYWNLGKKYEKRKWIGTAIPWHSVLCARMCRSLPCYQNRWRCFET